jgi:hypothetical protein
MLTYYDAARRRFVLRRRYVWAYWSFCAGLLTGALVGWLV